MYICLLKYSEKLFCTSMPRIGHFKIGTVSIILLPARVKTPLGSAQKYGGPVICNVAYSAP